MHGRGDKARHVTGHCGRRRRERIGGLLGMRGRAGEGQARAEWQKCDRTHSIESPGYYKGPNAGASVIARWTEKTTLKLR